MYNLFKVLRNHEEKMKNKGKKPKFTVDPNMPKAAEPVAKKPLKKPVY